jgi:hypothetical protein
MFGFKAFRPWVCAATTAFLIVTLAQETAQAQTCPFDNGGSTLANDGLVLTRYALGLRGAPMVANTSFAALDAPTIESNIACPSCGLRVTDDKDALNNPIFTVADATIISRKLAGFEGTALTNGLTLGSGSRNTPAAVQSFLLAGCGATGGTVTSVTAGTGLTGGTITAAGTIAADTTYLQRRIVTACSPGSFVTGVAADGTPTCAAPPANGGNGTVTSVGTGLGLVATGPNIVNGAIVSNGLMELAFGFILPQGCTTGQVPKSNGSGIWTCAADNAGSTVTNAFVNGGNTFGVPAVVGTTDGQPLTVGIGTNNGLRIVPSFVSSAPNIILGSGLNSISTASSVVGTTIGGGQLNTANGAFATISGGNSNSAAGNWATVAGGNSNLASGPYSFAAGRQAKAEAAGSFVWADSTPIDYRAGLANGATFANSFNVRATGGINLVTAVDASGVQTKGVNIGASGTLFSDALQVTGAASAASVNVTNATTTGTLKVGSSGSVIKGIQAGSVLVPAPGSTNADIFPDPTNCNRQNYIQRFCEARAYFAFPTPFPLGTQPRLSLTINHNNAVTDSLQVSVAIYSVDNVGVSYRVTQDFWVFKQTDGLDRPRPIAEQRIGWTRDVFVDWIAIAQ